MSENFVPAPADGLDQSRLTPKRSRILEAMNTELYVPTITPQIIAKTNPLITSPPNMNSDINAIKVVTEVITVLLSVSFIDRFNNNGDRISSMGESQL